jgi:protein-S-isoprenylcysteine O-methyltransferase Ste14
MADEQHDGARVIPIPPPLVYAGPLILGLAISRSVPGLPLPRVLRRNAGAALLGCGIALCTWFVRTMLQANTTLHPGAPAATLVTDGPFRFTRNPGYLGMAAISAGTALLANALPPLVFLAGVLIVITRGVIEPEEQYLERRFGTAYRGYKTRVRRWL